MASLTAPPYDPHAEVARRLDAHREAAAAARRADERLGRARVVAFLLAAGVSIAAAAGTWSWGWILLPLAAFAGLVAVHGRSRSRRLQAERRARLYESAIARMEDRWAGQGSPGEAFRPASHVYADDLDLFGEGSLFQLLSTARTRVGQARLARWMLEGAGPAAVRRRQAAVEALRGRLDLREDVALAGDEVRSALDRHAAEAWAAEAPRLAGRAYPRAVGVLGLLTTAACAGWALASWPFLPFGALAVFQFLFVLPVGRRVNAVLADADRPAQDLSLIARLLERFEAEAFEEGLLGELAGRLDGGGARPSRRIRRLVRLMDFVEARRNQIFLPLSWLLALGTQLAYGIEAWRARYGRDLVRWMDVLAELEALLALSAYAYEHPTDPFPEVVEDGVFVARELGHPLLPTAENVRNDVHLEGGAVQCLLVSGSNMSGKSTLLRSVGVATVMALMGCPVRAGTLRIGRLALGASIRIQDSLQGGASRFYAEIRRLKEIVDLARDAPPALFLLDEMLGGTNSHDRLLGADAVIHTLLDRHALGLVSTHDLALAGIAERDARAANVHFEDRLEDGRMVFDYRLQGGVVRHSNAVALMQAVGLDVRA
jgi:hypothetical protein